MVIHVFLQNGVISKDGDEYVIQPNWYAPAWSDGYNMDNTLDWPYHTLRKRNDRSLEADVDYGISMRFKSIYRTTILSVL